MSLKFDLTPCEEPVEIGEATYSLREASGAAACTYLNAVSACYEYGEGGSLKSIKALSDTGPLLVSLCLFDNENKPVPLTTIRSWPQRIQKALFERVKEMSDLNRDESLQDLYKQRNKIIARISKLEAEEEEVKNS